MIGSYVEIAIYRRVEKILWSSNSWINCSDPTKLFVLACAWRDLHFQLLDFWCWYVWVSCQTIILVVYKGFFLCFGFWKEFNCHFDCTTQETSREKHAGEIKIDYLKWGKFGSDDRSKCFTTHLRLRHQLRDSAGGRNSRRRDRLMYHCIVGCKYLNTTPGLRL